MSNKVIGIDLGTSNSCVAVMEGGDPSVITNEEGSRTTPSVVAYVKGDVLVGSPAKRQAVTNAESTIYSAKRFIGMRFDEVEAEAVAMPFEVRKSNSGMCEIASGHDFVAPQAVSAQVLSKMRTAAERYLGHEVTQAVITVPAYFNDAQRQATRDAGKIAGLEVRRIINEPTAAALAYGMDKGDDKKILVYDLGGGTFDVSVLEIGDGVVEVVSTSGDTHLGGDDIDKLIIDWMADDFSTQHGIEIRSDSMVMQRLREAAERAKIELSSTQTTNINLPFLTADATGPKHLQLDLSRSDFEKMIYPVVSKTLNPVKRALKDSGLDPKEIDEVLLVGGSTRIPLVRREVEKFFDQEVSSSVNPDEVVALGAAVQGGVFTGETSDILLLDVTPLSLGLETMGGIMTKLIERNSTIPCSKSQIFTTAEDNQSAVDIKVLQGEREFATDNKKLGTFRLAGIPPAPRGTPQIEVTFDINADGLVSVKAVDKATSHEQKIVITGSGAMPKEEIEKLIKDAEQNRESDKKKKKEVEEKNSLESLIFQAESLLSEHGEKVQHKENQSLEAEISGAKEALRANEPSAIESSLSSLQAQLQEFGKAIHQQQSASESTSTDDDDVVDAEFEET